MSRSQSPAHTMRTVSSEASVLAHPMPDLQSIQGAYIQNVERLEERAERMSMGSDIGEEIRKLQLEQKLSDSRRSSLLSSNAPDYSLPSRNVSVRSFANSIVEVNSAARYGGYSPAAFIASPIASLPSGSWSQLSHSASFSRSLSLSKSSRLASVASQDDSDEFINTPVHDPALPSAPKDRPHRATSDSFLRPNPDPLSLTNDQTKRLSRLPSDRSFTNLYNRISEAKGSTSHMSATRIPSDVSFTEIYDQIAGEIRNHLEYPRRGVSARSTTGEASIQQLLKAQGAREREVSASNHASEADDASRRRASTRQLPLRNTSVHTIPENGSAPIYAHTEDADDYQPDDNPHAPQNLPNRTPTAASNRTADTYQQAQTMFCDFDGAHFAPSIREDVDEGPADFDTEDSSLLKMLPPLSEPRMPPPADGMIYYPAPVPRVLNMPQRLSQAPSAAIQARRRTQVLESMPFDVRKSAPWLENDRRESSGNLLDSEGLRGSRPNLATLPPQLRASMFFEHTAQRQEVTIKEGSAMSTFEDLLDASAKAPVSAFTNHPMVGHVGTGVYKRVAAVRSSVALHATAKALRKLGGNEAQDGTRRASSLELRRSSPSFVNTLDVDGDRADRRESNYGRNSSISLIASALNPGPVGETFSGTFAPLSQNPGVVVLDENGDPIEKEFSDDEGSESVKGREDDEDDVEFFPGPPVTLLAELALRQSEQKSRIRTAFTSSPNGLHSTLLELDAVAQLEKKKRKEARVTLAWEDPNLRAVEDAIAGNDDDVPLGLLFSKKSAQVKAQLREQGLQDWDQPLGLIKQRDIDDNEPLSRRRNRLLGIKPVPSTASRSVGVDNADAGAESDDDETLAQRLRRLKDKKGLDEAIGTNEQPVSTAFSAEMLGEFGIHSQEEEKLQSSQLNSGKSSPTPNRLQSTTPAEETLGQRRTRLKKEAAEDAHRKSRTTLDLDAADQSRRQDKMNLSIGLGHLPRPQSMMTLNPSRPSMYVTNDGSPETVLPAFNPRNSMANILAAQPVGRNETRKFSNEQLLAALPPDSLLARNEGDTQGRKAMLRESNRMSSGLVSGVRESFVEVPEPRPYSDRRASGGHMGDFGLGEDTPPHQYPVGTIDNGFQSQHMRAYGLPESMSMYPQMGLNIGSNMGSMMSGTRNVSQNGRMMHANPASMGVAGFNTAGNPNLLAGMNPSAPLTYGLNQTNVIGGFPTYQRQSAYAALPVYQQQYHQYAPVEAGVDPKTRDRVDAWRQSIMP